MTRWEAAGGRRTHPKNWARTSKGQLRGTVNPERV